MFAWSIGGQGKLPRHVRDSFTCCCAVVMCSCDFLPSVSVASNGCLRFLAHGQVFAILWLLSVLCEFLPAIGLGVFVICIFSRRVGILRLLQLLCAFVGFGSNWVACIGCLRFLAHSKEFAILLLLSMFV